MMRLLWFAAVEKIDPSKIGIPRVELTNNTIGLVVSSVFILIGSLAVLFMLVGAVRYVTANGEQARITQAKNTILYAIIGLVVSTLGFTIVQFVVGKLTGTL